MINDDYIAPSMGFGMHPHKDMEILTYVLNGRVAHKDSMGNQTEVKAGEFQIMSAGTGIYHSEFNPDAQETLHLYQIWIMPHTKGITPRYSQGSFAEKQGATLILSPNAEQGSFKVYQDMKLWRYQFLQKNAENLALDPTRRYWLQVVKGSLLVEDHLLFAGDAVGISQQATLSIENSETVEFLLFDLV
ncbi:quercetin 2,3-dioxygenase yhhW [Bibersteinia trehalosi USDA-ARS-USMARC-189]|uniref:Quercetin 2,3-dioxygenase yhhW n=1 Tax=Bibersteinia trehalosi USDA-ARS-USMARC-189 TaxID=1263831 RepID=A0ABM5PAF6_BIBTR|nr:quercetin 2,3-dioxygenase yhhW [Bibersteinia trehalosi USDA-ARS-USMARC-189]